MTRLHHALALTALLLLAALSLDARLAGVRADDLADCTKGSGDTAIRGCSAIIKSRRLFGKPISNNNLATIYYNRGIVYDNKGQYDLAIADYGKASGSSRNVPAATTTGGWPMKNSGSATKPSPTSALPLISAPG